MSKTKFKKKYEKKTIEKKQWSLKHPLTDEQEALAYNMLKAAIGEAVAGSGKSTTLLAMIFKMMEDNADLKILLTIFSKALQEELAPYARGLLDILTKHALGYKVFYANGKKPFVDDKKDMKIIMQDLKFDPQDEADPKRRRQAWAILFNMVDLADKCRVRLIDFRDAEAVHAINCQYGCGVDDIAMVQKLLRISTEKGLSGHIGFTEMNYIPVIGNWKMPKYDILCLDEAQDLSPMDAEFLTRCMHDDSIVRIIGDRRQSIMGFAGADTQMIDKLRNKFSAEMFPISVTFRCPNAVVEAVRQLKFHETIKAWSGARDGVFDPEAIYNPLEYDNGTMILSRRNATLIPYAIKAHKQGRSVSVLGGGIEFKLLSILKNMDANTITGLYAAVSDEHMQKIDQLTNGGAKQSAIDFTNDLYDTLTSIINECTLVDQVEKTIYELFKVKKDSLIYSSIHRSKGKESDRVVILDSDRMTLDLSKLGPEEIQQEINLQYVACTRPKYQLDFVK
jgi:superfamily I DNA/RNA helicase